MRAANLRQISLPDGADPDRRESRSVGVEIITLDDQHVAAVAAPAREVTLSGRLGVDRRDHFEERVSHGHDGVPEAELLDRRIVEADFDAEHRGEICDHAIEVASDDDELADLHAPFIEESTPARQGAEVRPSRLRRRAESRVGPVRSSTRTERLEVERLDRDGSRLAQPLASRQGLTRDRRGADQDLVHLHPRRIVRRQIDHGAGRAVFVEPIADPQRLDGARERLRRLTIDRA